MIDKTITYKKWKSNYNTTIYNGIVLDKILVKDSRVSVALSGYVVLRISEIKKGKSISCHESFIDIVDPNDLTRLVIEHE